MSKELGIHQLDTNPPPPQVGNALEKDWYLRRQAGRGQRSVILSVKRDTIIKMENAVNVESSMAHLFKGKREREGERKKKNKERKKERKNKQQAFALELTVLFRMNS